MAIYVGIDPGLSGAVAVIFPDGSVSVFDAPTLQVKKGKSMKHEYEDPAMFAILERVREFSRGHAICALEFVAAMPGQGVSSMFSLGTGMGLWRMALAGNKIPWRFVTPVSWKKRYNLLGKGKQAARLEAMRLFPKVDLSKKKHDGRADALFLAMYARDVLDGGDKGVTTLVEGSNGRAS